ncbi:PAP2 superfamily [Lentimicrobium saccharophilum]|uniref:PAP2 superfamily n=1 Tax=Lentimicrobium saccharophilum TaxID=1678841 RepID=A0A0S7BWH9_9BACT|nr:phosphatase PAP2 family protein [Lentimicrobium saccharophilum]GAP45258.1 PAP2 superfamily [Lentimicrobium saccharophilum]
MIKVLRHDQWLFFLLTGIYWLFLSILLLLEGYRGSFLLLNGLHRPWLDYPMFILTHLGDALILTSLLALLLTRTRPDLVLLLIITVAITGLFGQLLKNTFFDGWDRPLRVFAETGGVHTVAGYKMYHNAFPSGHSIVAAAAITTLVLNLPYGYGFRFWMGLAVIIISYTRIYTGVHFAGDVLAGTVIGAAGAIMITAWLAEPMKKRTEALTVNRARRMRWWLWGIALFSFVAGVALVVDML